MEKLLLIEDYNSTKSLDGWNDYIDNNGVHNDIGIIISSCISKQDALDYSNNSKGLKIKLKNNGKEFEFGKYTSGNLPIGKFAIHKETINSIFLDLSINSIIVILCDNDEIIIKESIALCTGGVGGDGVKVKIPAGTP